MGCDDTRFYGIVEDRSSICKNIRSLNTSLLMGWLCCLEGCVWGTVFIFEKILVFIVIVSVNFM